MKICSPEAAALSLALAALPAGAQALPADYVAPGIRLIEAGIICAADPVGMQPAPDTLTGFVNTIRPDATFVSPSREIPAVPGLGFGVRTQAFLRLHDSITITVTHPPMGPGGATQQTYLSTIPIGPRINGYFLEYERDLVPGDWTISASEGDVPLFAVHFTLVDPAELPGMAGLCEHLSS